MNITELLGIGSALFTLTLLEIVLGVDNLVFISVASSRLPTHQQKRARQVGLMLAWVTRLIFLFFAIWMVHLTKPFLHIMDIISFSVRDLFFIGGGLFLLYKAAREIHYEVEPEHTDPDYIPKPYSFTGVVTQIALLDIVFSFDSVITAVGMTHLYWVMAVAITIAIIVMIIASHPLSEFIEKHATLKMLALCFLILISVMLIADGFQYHIPRGYIYFAIFFSLFVEFINNLSRRRRRQRQRNK